MTTIPAVSPAAVKPQQRKKKRITRNQWKLMLLVSPFVLLTLIFHYVPLAGWIIAFYDYRPGIPLRMTEFVGLKYFRIILFESSEIGRVLRNTLVLSFLGIAASPIYVAFAVLLNEVRSSVFRRFVQTTTTLPNFISWVLVYSVFFTFFSVQDGVVNNVLFKLDWITEPTNLLGDNGKVWIFQTLVVMWKGMGWSAIIYLAAISGIDTEQYDAAKVDGAGRFRTMRHITIPGILPTFLVLMVLSVGNMLSNGFDQFFVFYNALVADRIEVLDYYVYRIGLGTNDFPYSTALGMFKTLISVTLLFIVNALARRVRGENII